MAKQHFDTEHLKDDLKGRSVRSGAITLAAGAGSFVISMGATAVLARLLKPEDFGLIGMVAVVVSFIVLFKDMGLSMATIQQDKITHEQISTLFWINLVISSGIAVLTAALAPLIAWFFDEPILFWVALAGAPGQILGGLVIQHQALLRRQMKFGKLAAIQIISQLVGIATAIAMAWHEFGVWSLVGQTLSTQMANMLMVWFASGWLPGKPVRGSGVRPMLKMGGFLTGFNITNHFARNLDNILIGKFAGKGPLGMYQKAYSLLMLPIHQINTPITAIAIPALSRLQSEPETYRRYYQRAVGLLVIAGMPIIAFAAIAADPIIRILLGEQWVDAVPIFRALVPAAFIGTFNVATGWVYMSLGTTHRQFKYGILAAVLTCTGFAIGAQWGAIGVAWSLSINFVLIRYPAVCYCFKGSPLRPKDLGSVLWKPALAAICAAVAVGLFDHFVLFELTLFLRFGVMALAYTVAYLVFWLILPGGRQHLIQSIGLIRELKG